MLLNHVTDDLKMHKFPSKTKNEKFCVWIKLNVCIICSDLINLFGMSRLTILILPLFNAETRILLSMGLGRNVIKTSSQNSESN